MGRIPSSHHLFRPSSLYHFRLVVPPELRSIVGQREIRYSLRTGQLSHAKYLALQMNGFVQRLFQNLRGNAVMKTLTEHDIKAILDRFYLDMLQQDEMARTLTQKRSEDAQEESNRLRQAKKGLRKALADCAHGDFPVSANLLLQQSGFECDQDSDLFKRFCREMLKAAMKVTEVQGMRAEGNYSYDVPTGHFPHTIEPNEPPSKLLSELNQLFLEDKDSAGKWEPKTREEYAACLNLLKEVISDVPVRNITYEVMKDFRDQIRKLPANMNEKPRYRDKTVREILEMEVDDPMSITNVNKYLVRASTCFNFAVKHDFMAKNPAEGLQIKQSKRADELRDRFTDEDLKRLFGSEEYIEDNHRHSYFFWLPVLALYTGCRLNELCQLHLDDMKEVDGVWVIDVNEECMVSFQ